jgi:hypothetical protein
MATRFLSLVRFLVKILLHGIRIVLIRQLSCHLEAWSGANKPEIE